MKILLFLSFVAFVINGCQETQKTSKKQVKQEILHVNKTIQLTIKGMVCEMGCGSSIRKALIETKAVKKCVIYFKEKRAENTVLIGYDSTKITPKKITQILSSINDKQFTLKL